MAFLKKWSGRMLGNWLLSQSTFARTLKAVQSPTASLEASDDQSADFSD